MRMASCHPDREYDAKGLCHSCYVSRWAKTQKDRTNLRNNSNRSYAKNKKKYTLEERERSLRYKKAAFALLGNKCAHCGITDFRVLQFDHINGGGVKELRNSSHSTDLRYRRVLENPERFQLLCANCNMIKRYENREGPRQLDPGEAKDEVVQAEISDQISGYRVGETVTSIN